jgi:putative ABC transport system permease protein
MRVTRTMSWIIAAIASVIGALGVLNTMAMSVFERRSEIGSLRAMGWRTSRVIQLILSESLLLAAAGAAVGIVIGLAGLVLLSHWHVTSGIVQGDVSYRAIGEGVLLAAAMAVVGAAYPAFRIARVPPVESLRGS